MAEENTTTMNLDLNLGPIDNNSGEENGLPSGSFPNVAMNLEDWLDGPVHRVREVVRHRNQRWRSWWRQLPIPPETRSLALELISGTTPQTGEGSVPSGPTDEVKNCENATGLIEDDPIGKNKDGAQNNSDDGSFFDCNICLDLAKDPVVTCCGHLFCWPCLYRWLHDHSEAKECPVCKGEVTTKNVTPIYGRGNNNINKNNTDDHDNTDLESGQKVPHRPQARRVESWRQTIQRTAFTIPMEQMIRRLGSTFDLGRELAQMQSGPQESPERSNTALLNRILTSRGMRRERTPVEPHHDDVIDLTESSPPNRLSSLLHRRSNSHRAATLANLTSAINSAESLAAERLVESYFHNNPVDRNNQEMETRVVGDRLVEPYFHNNPVDRNNQEMETRVVVDDRDSVSSIAAVIHSESQTVDNAIEIDSTVSLSTSSSRRRYDASRISDVDSGDSRAPRRRRLN